MKLVRRLEDLPPQLRRGAVSIGNFDGVHLGHARLIERLASRAREHGGPALVFTFDPHPAAVLRPENVPPALTWTERKAEILARLGVDMVVAYAADASLFELGPEEFFARFILRHLESQAIVEGPNFFFGRARKGDIRLLEQLCRGHKLTIEVVEPLLVGGEIVSSSRIRKLIAAGDVAAANHLLVESYRIRGTVVHGAGRGGKLGFPTINLENIDTLLPADGIYAARAYLGNRVWTAAVNIGSNCTFGEECRKIEAHLIGADEDFYGAEFQLEFVARLRELRKFAVVDELIEQIKEDIAATVRIITEVNEGNKVLNRPIRQ